MFSVTINPREVEAVTKMLRVLVSEDSKKALVRGLNKTMTGVRTDGVKILKDRYALTATAIRDSFKIKKAAFSDPHGVVSTKGTFIRLMKFGARQTPTGVSVKVLRASPRKIIKHAFFAKLGKTEQVYWRKWRGARKKYDPRKVYAKMPFGYRFPVHARYGPRIQDHLDDPAIIGKLLEMAGQRLTKNMEHEVDYLLRSVR